MKKVTYLMTILFAVVLMSTSCCKDDPVPNTPLTKSEITGSDWMSVSYNGTACGACNTGEVTDITLTTAGSGEYDFELLDNCYSSNRWYVDVELNDDATELNLVGTGTGTFEFDVVSYEDGLLTLYLTFTNVGNVPSNGTYVLEKS